MSYLEQWKAAIEQRAGLSELLRSIPTEAAKREKTPAGEIPPLSGEEQERFNKVDADILALDETIKRYERLKDEEARTQPTGRLTDPGQPSNGAESRVDFNSALKRWGLGRETAEDRSALNVSSEGKGSAIEITAPVFNRDLLDIHGEKRTVNRERLAASIRAQSVGTDSAGGYTVPEGFWNSLISARLQYGGMRQARTFVFNTASGNDLPIPTVNDTSNVGAILAENAAINEQDFTFAQVILGAYKYESKVTKVSFELMQDSAFDLASFIGRDHGVRLGRIENLHFTTGTGSGQPNGVVTASTLGKTAASATAVTYAELLDLKHSVDPAYRLGAEWMFNDGTLKALKQLAVGAGDARPLWAPGMAVGEPSTIDGDPYVINQNMPAMTTGLKSILFGDFSNYWIRDVGSIRVIRLDELYRGNDQTGFISFMRTDADLINAGTNPIKHLIQA